ncbi:MAG: ATP-binding protein [Deltaproteobacteria bacterium]|nr:MAG: ATP-binding protein [Deltaproteobacteria bacterium]
MEFIRRFFQIPEDSFFLFGPRGTGKSMWLRHSLPGAFFVDLLDPETFRAYLSRPERLREVVKGNPLSRQFVIDEIQKVPALLDVVHQLIEEQSNRQIRFILTGSSARKLKRAGVDLLAGRLLLRTLHPFMAAELGSLFDLNQAMQLGLLPLVLGAINPQETLRSYVSLYLREEVQAEGLIRNIGNFSRFMDAVSFSHGSQLNISDVARDCQVGRKTVEGYLEILEDLLLGFRIPVFSKRTRRHLVQHPKFYFMDAGIFRSLRPKGPLDTPEEIGGACLEGLVAQHLRAWIAYSRSDHELYFWRTKSGVEVDFIIYGDTFVAIEIKASRSISSKDIRPLKSFLKDYPQAQAFLLYGGQERLKINDILCLPCEEFLRRLTPDSRIE